MQSWPTATNIWHVLLPPNNLVWIASIHSNPSMQTFGKLTYSFNQTRILRTESIFLSFSSKFKSKVGIVKKRKYFFSFSVDSFWKRRPKFNIINNTIFEFVVPPLDINIDMDSKYHYQLTNWSMLEKPTNWKNVHTDQDSCQKAQVKVQRGHSIWSAREAPVTNSVSLFTALLPLLF